MSETNIEYVRGYSGEYLQYYQYRISYGICLDYVYKTSIQKQTGAERPSVDLLNNAILPRVFWFSIGGNP